MGLQEVVAFVGRRLIDCASAQELKEAIHDLRSRSPESALADLGEEKVAALETWCKRMRLEPCHELKLSYLHASPPNDKEPPPST
jgi:hypothetical protein